MINLHVITNEAVHPPLLLSLQLLECIPLTFPHQFLLQIFQRPNNSIIQNNYHSFQQSSF